MAFNCSRAAVERQRPCGTTGMRPCGGCGRSVPAMEQIARLGINRPVSAISRHGPEAAGATPTLDRSARTTDHVNVFERELEDSADSRSNAATGDGSPACVATACAVRGASGARFCRIRLLWGVCRPVGVGPL
jgi:hypothetical protein